MLNEFLNGLSKEELIDLTIAYQNYLVVDHEDEFNHMDRAPVCLMEFYDNEYQELIEKEKITMYFENQSNELAKILNEIFGIDITEKQTLLVMNYLEGSGFAIGIGENKIYQLDTEVGIDSDVDYVDPEEKALSDIVHQILGWQDDFSQSHGDVDIDRFTLEDMQDEESFNKWCGGIIGTYDEREKIRKELLQLKEDEIELMKLLQQCNLAIKKVSE